MGTTKGNGVKSTGFNDKDKELMQSIKHWLG